MLTSSAYLPAACLELSSCKVHYQHAVGPVKAAARNLASQLRAGSLGVTLRPRRPPGGSREEAWPAQASPARKPELLLSQSGALLQASKCLVRAALPALCLGPRQCSALLQALYNALTRPHL